MSAGLPRSGDFADGEVGHEDRSRLRFTKCLWLNEMDTRSLSDA